MYVPTSDIENHPSLIAPKTLKKKGKIIIPHNFLVALLLGASLLLARQQAVDEGFNRLLASKVPVTSPSIAIIKAHFSAPPPSPKS